MKTKAQIKERIEFLRSRAKDGVDVSETVKDLEWCIIASESDLLEELANSVANGTNIPFQYMRTLLWVLE